MPDKLCDKINSIIFVFSAKIEKLTLLKSSNERKNNE